VRPSHVRSLVGLQAEPGKIVDDAGIVALVERLRSVSSMRSTMVPLLCRAKRKL
jgi:hypothetical protein